MSRDSRSEETGRSVLIGRALFVAAIVAAALAGGAVETGVLLPVAIAISLAAVLHAGRTLPAPRRPARLIVGLLVGLTALTLFQAIPLPAAFANLLSPHAGQIWRDCLGPMHEAGPTWHPLSLDPQATRAELVRWSMYLTAFVCALSIASDRAGARFAQFVLLGAATSLALSVAIHWAFGWEKIWGVYAPRTLTGAGPMVNANHLAAYVNVGIAVALSSLLSERPLLPRAILGAVVLLLVAAEVRLASRGGVGAMVVGFVLVGILSRSKTLVSRRLEVALIAVVATAGVVLLVLAGFEDSFRGLTDTNTSKLHVPMVVLREMVPRYFFFGVGRGAFESTFAEFRDVPGDGFVVFTHPENVVAQWAAEWGALASLAAFVVLALALRPTEARVRGSVARGAWVALAVVGLQNLVDFNTEVPAVMLLLIVCTAIVVGGSSADARGVGERSRMRRPVGVLGVVVALAAVWCWTGAGHDLVSERDAVFELAKARSPELDGALRSAIEAHPAEPYFPYLAAVDAARTGKGTVIVWVNRTLERSPIYGPAHMVLARYLRRRSPAQARLEYRLAALQRSTIEPESGELAGMVGDFDDALELVPEGKAGTPTLDSLSVQVESRLPATAARIDAEILRRDANASGAAHRMAQRALLDVLDPEGAPWCAASQACAAEALAAAARATATDPTHCAGAVVTARVRIAMGESSAALDELQAAADAADDRPTCLAELARIAFTSGDRTRANRAAVDLSNSNCGSDRQCVEVLLTAASLEREFGNENQAVVFLRRAVNLMPDRVDLQEQFAGSASRSGLHGDALASYVTLQRLDPANPKWGALANAERTAMTMSPR